VIFKIFLCCTSVSESERSEPESNIVEILQTEIMQTKKTLNVIDQRKMYKPDCQIKIYSTVI
jgi:hypothetical protein